jgi:5'-nucleotidase
MSRIRFDIDDTVLPLVPHWLKKYNDLWGDNLSYDQITDWNIGSFTKSECQNKMYDFLEDPHLYDDITPLPDALTAVNKLRELDNEIIWATTSTVGSSGRKFIWLQDHGFFQKGDAYFETLTGSKHLIKADISFDDKFEFAKDFDGLGFLLVRPWNKKYLPYSPSFEHWSEFIEIMEMINNNDCN